MEQQVPSNWIASLAPEQREWLETWRSQYGYAEQLSVGQLIHFLIDHKQPVRIEYRPSGQQFFEVWTRYNPTDGWHARERHTDLINSLWRHVVYLLDHPLTYRKRSASP